jgi:hypothetical protein
MKTTDVYWMSLREAKVKHKVKEECTGKEGERKN